METADFPVDWEARSKQLERELEYMSGVLAVMR